MGLKPTIHQMRVQSVYEPTGSFVNNMGAILDLLAPHTTFRQYSASQIQFKNDKQKVEGTISWKRTDFIISVPANIGHAMQAASTIFSNSFWDLMGVKKIREVTVGGHLFFECKQHFPQLLPAFSQRFTTRSFAPFGDAVDVGITLDFKLNDMLSLTVGPMSNEEITERFDWENHGMKSVVFCAAQYKTVQLAPSDFESFLKRSNQEAFRGLPEFVDGLEVVK